MVFVSGTGIAVTLHEVFAFHVIFPQAVDHDMDVDIAGMVFAIEVGTDKRNIWR